jgi:hypothetical protein
MAYTEPDKLQWHTRNYPLAMGSLKNGASATTAVGNYKSELELLPLRTPLANADEIQACVTPATREGGLPSVDRHRYRLLLRCHRLHHVGRRVS